MFSRVRVRLGLDLVSAWLVMIMHTVFILLSVVTLPSKRIMLSYAIRGKGSAMYG